MTTRPIHIPPPGRSDGVQHLNAADRLMLVAHEGMRRMGHPGFQCQTHIWLDGRLDVDRFKPALAKLRAVYPVIVSRLMRDERGRPMWRFDAVREVEFVEHSLSGSESSDIWRYGEGLFETPLDLDQRDPIGFHLLHLPDGRDVLIVRFSHVLMDGKSPEFALAEIDRLFAEIEAPSDGAQRSIRAATLKEQWSDPGGSFSETKSADALGRNAGAANMRDIDELDQQLRRHGFRKRLASSWNVIRSQIKLPIQSAVMARGDISNWVFKPLRILVREMDEARTKAAADRVRRLCGFANLSPAVLASVFRAIRELSDKPITRRTGFKTDVPLNLRAPGQIHPVFRNYMSFIQMSARPGELNDRDALTRTLNAYMRDQLRRGVDVGTIQMMTIMSRMEKLLARHLLDRMRKDPISLGFGFLGQVLPSLEQFCGRRVDRLYSLNASISPPGMVLQVIQFRGKMSLVMTYIGSVVSDELANRFAEFIMDDLTQ